MEDKLVLGLPDAAASIAPKNRFAERERPEVKLRSVLMPAFLMTAFGLFLARLRSETADKEGEQAPKPSSDDGSATPTDSEAIGAEIINNVAAYLRQAASEASSAQHILPVSAFGGSIFGGGLSSLQGLRPPGGTDGSRSGVQDPANDNSDPDEVTFPDLSVPGGSTGGSGPDRDDDQDDDDDDGRDDDDDDDDGGDDDDDDDDDDDTDTDSNRLPVVAGRVILSSGLMNLSALILLDDLAALASDPDGDPLSIANLTVSSGMVRSYGPGLWIYTPERGFLGEVTFTYQISDGTGSVSAQALIDLLKAPPHELVGTAGDDVLLGTPQDDIIDALAGNDIVYGREDDDVIFGGAGNDILLGGDGDDVLSGEEGNDRLFGGDGNDVLFGGDGDDWLHGEDGDDILVAGMGNDVLDGGTGDDRLFGEDGHDKLSGESGDDLIEGGDGSDVLSGGTGDDVVSGESGNDRVVTGLGAEEVRLASAATLTDGNDTYSGGAGVDTYDASLSSYDLVIDLAARLATGADIGTDHIEGFEAATGGAGDDTLMGDGQENTLAGGAGDDMLTGADGDDTVIGGVGNDTVLVVASAGYGDDGDDNYSGGDGVDTYDASFATSDLVIDLAAKLATGEDIGTDHVDGFEAAIGGAGDDTLLGDGQDNTFAGGDGDDMLSGQGGDDLLAGGTGDDVVSGGSGNDRVVTGPGTEEMLLSATADGNDSYSGGAGFDTYDASLSTYDLVIDLAAKLATGTDIGTDHIEGFEAAIAGAGDDTLMGDDQDNTLAGGDGDDTVTAGAGDDTVLVLLSSGGADDGDDSYSGGAGVDTYDASATVSGVVIDLESGLVTGIEVGTDQIDGFEAAVAGSGNDVLVAGSQVNFLTGGAGDDVFVFHSSAALWNDGGGADEILDFRVGDRIDLSDLADEIGGLMFDRIMDEVDDHQDITRIRLYSEFSDGEQTLVRAVIDLDDERDDLELLIYSHQGLTEQDFILAAHEINDDGARV